MDLMKKTKNLILWGLAILKSSSDSCNVDQFARGWLVPQSESKMIKDEPELNIKFGYLKAWILEHLLVKSP